MTSGKTGKYIVVPLSFLLVFFAGDCFSAIDRVKSDEGFKPGSCRIELRDLGYESTDLIPPDESAVTSLAEGAGGDIYGGTTGRVCHLFVFSRSSNDVKHLGRINGQESIHHSLVADDEGTIYFGTGLNELKQYPLSEPMPGFKGIVKTMWLDIEKRYSGYEGGHLYKFDISKEKRRWIGQDDECIAEDLGVAVPHNGIYALTINNGRKEIYGLSYPDGHFFVYRIKAAEFADMGEIYKQKIFGGPDNRTLRSISRALICDDKGFVYGSGDDGAIFRYDPEKREIKMLEVKIPLIYYSVVEAFVKDKDGIIYGGTSEGYLFKFDPGEIEVANLGKPLAQLRIRGLVIGRDGVIYGIAGERTNHCRIFSYDISKSKFDDLGILQVVREPYYSWTALQMDSMVMGRDGIIYIGESERMSHLFLYYP